MRLGQMRGGKPGAGVRKGDQVQHVARFDDEMFARIRAKALRDGTSLSEAIRTLIEWGLEAEEQDA
jgi:hypothetical protein